MDTLTFILTTVVFGTLASLPTIIVGQLLATKGTIHEKPMQVLVVGVVGMFFARLAASKWPIGIQLILLAISMPIGIYRADLWAKRR